MPQVLVPSEPHLTNDGVMSTFLAWSLFFTFSALSSDLNVPLNKTYPPPLPKGRAYSCKTYDTEQKNQWFPD